MRFENLESELYKELEDEILFSAIEEDLEKELKQEKKALNKKKKRHKKDNGKVVTILKSDIKIKTILLLLFTLIMNTYAWFIYISRVSMDMEMHIKSWNFELYTGEQEENFTFAVEEIYPGMPDASKVITANNMGETAASLTCEVTSVKILDETFQVGKDYTAEDGSTFNYTSDDLLDKITNDYPFKIQIFINGEEFTGDETVLTQGNSTEIEVKVVWPYETLDGQDNPDAGDIIDTEWGQKAYNYYADNAGNPGEIVYCIEVNIEIKAVQNNNPI